MGIEGHSLPSDELPTETGSASAHVENLVEGIEDAAEVAEIYEFVKNLLESDDPDEQMVGTFYKRTFIPHLEALGKQDTNDELSDRVESVRKWMDYDKKAREEGSILKQYNVDLLREQTQ